MITFPGMPKKAQNLGEFFPHPAIAAWGSYKLIDYKYYLSPAEVNSDTQGLFL
jgi:hypothetical protein